MIQETKCKELSKRMIKSIWGDEFDWVCKNVYGEQVCLISRFPSQVNISLVFVLSNKIEYATW